MAIIYLKLSTYFNLKYLVVIACLLCSCATVKNPDGGAKDEIAPKPITYSPVSNSTNFSAKGFTITFDEFFKIVDPQKNVLISPPLKSKATFKVKGKNLLVSWEDTLKANTTYNFYFANAIADYNEGNDTSFSYIFSTGSYLDSLQISCMVKDAYSLKPLSETWVMAYVNDQFNPAKETPDFIAKTSKNGIASFTNLPAKSLNIIALKDKNFNLKYDHLVDEIGFLDSSINSNNNELINLLVSKPEDTLELLESSTYIHPGRVQLLFNKTINPISLFEIEDDQNPLQSANDTLIFQAAPNITKGKYQFYLKLNGQIDTISFYVPKEIEKTLVKPILKNQGSLRANQAVLLDFNRPIEFVGVDGFRVYKDSLEIPIEVSRDRISPNLVSINADWQAGQIYLIKLDTSAIQGRHQTFSDSMAYSIKIREHDYFAQLKINVNHANGMLELLKNNLKVTEFQANGKQTINHLQPGKYSLRLFIDLNKDGEWTPGNFLKNHQPEPVYYYPEVIELRSGWSEEIEWIIPE